MSNINIINNSNMYNKILLAVVLLLFFTSAGIPLNAHKTEKHSEQICYVLFGCKNTATFNSSTNSHTMRAYELIRRAVAVAIDNKGTETNDYKELEDRLVGSSVKIPSLDELEIKNIYHRQVCHQGFDYIYTNAKSNKRWNDVGRKLLISVAREAFTYNSDKPNDGTATFIAMIAYYTHILGDLEEGETKWMQNSVGTFYKFLKELILKVDKYGKELKNPSYIDDLKTKLEKLQPKMPTVRADQVKNRLVYSEQILEVLSEYIPKIIQNNVNVIFKFNVNFTALEVAA